ncbi:MAG: hypothetical protein MI920_18635 [Kiloniellales bacterium]|nr:hypothetical protein [Kiloniellales bacterium]
MRGFRSLSLLLLILLTAGAQAQVRPDFDWATFRTGEDLFGDCAAADDFDRGVCFGYIMAIADALGGPGARIDGLQACVDAPRSSEELVQTVTDFLSDNPGSRSIRADGLAAYALSLEFPCTRP